MITCATAPPACSLRWRWPAAKGPWALLPAPSARRVHRLPGVAGQALSQAELHLICDNYGTHKHPAVKQWLAAHPRFHLHFTPTSASWLNLVERWFGLITAQAIRRGSFDSVA